MPIAHPKSNIVGELKNVEGILVDYSRKAAHGSNKNLVDAILRN